MKARFKALLTVLVMVVAILPSHGQLPVITSFSQSGVLICSNLEVGSVATVAWASSLSGPWQTNLGGLSGLAVNSGGSITVTAPLSSATMFFRVLDQTNLAGQPPQYTADGMALISAGTFTMGDILDGESDALPTNIYVSSFYMDTNLVSYSQWQAIYNYALTNGYNFVHGGAGKAANQPVQTVDWFDCVKWSNARSQQAGLVPVYYTDAGLTQVFLNGDDGTTVYANWQANGYRLPTEAEWEKSARGGLSGQRFPWGLTISESQANYSADPNPPNSGGYTYDLGPYTGFNTNFDTGMTPFSSPVGSFAANGYGLYDMAGNMLEWCWDWYGTPYGQATNMNPTGPVSGNYRVLRGGGWSNPAAVARCAYRGDFYPASAYLNFGFRCVRGL